MRLIALLDRIIKTANDILAVKCFSRTISILSANFWLFKLLFKLFDGLFNSDPTSNFG